MIEETALIDRQETLQGGYRRLVLAAPHIAAAAAPGQFVHLRIPGPANLMLRRPFSIHSADGDYIMLLYKSVGRGTRQMTALHTGEKLSLLGPLGRGFPLDCEDALPVLVAGGYGMAALYFLAQRLPRIGMVFAGGKDKEDILCSADFAALQWPVETATENGSLGVCGLVTDPLDAWLAAREHVNTVFYACGPHGMLRAVAERARQRHCRAWVSLDRYMGCGVGACLACVQKICDADGSLRWIRVCREGPVFAAGDIVWDA